MLGEVYVNDEYDVGLYTEGLSGLWKCEKCGKILDECGIDFAANNRQATRYDIPKELSQNHNCDNDE